jgi:hypothetical protein
MGQLQKKYVMKGLDLRSNKLFRKEGTASDCRNVFLDENQNLVKRPDFALTTIPRGTDGETGEFRDKLPYDATILDIVRFKTYAKEEKILVCAIIVEGMLNDTYNMKFYRWDSDANTVEFIDFLKYTQSSSTWGTYVGYTSAQHEGKLTFTMVANKLYMCGKRPANIALDESDKTAAAEFELVPVMVYDGEFVRDAGVVPGYNSPLFESREDYPPSLLFYDMTRVLPITWDSQGLPVLGNYLASSSFQPTQPADNPNYQELSWGKGFDAEEVVGRQVSARITSPVGTYSNGATLNIAPDTGPGGSTSIHSGQVMYYAYNRVTINNGGVNADVVTDLYRFKVSNVTSTTCDISEIHIASRDEDFVWTPSDLDLGDPDPESIGIFANFMSSVVYAVYATKESFDFGFEYRVMLTAGRDTTFFAFARYPAVDNIYTQFDTATYSHPRVGVTKFFEDTYQEGTVKLPPPLAKSVTSYVRQLLVSDHEQFYFNDLSVGGGSEAFLPDENIPVGTIEDGAFTGVFASESVLAAFREKNSYYISGNIFTGNYTIQSYRVTKIGCTDPKSIVDYKGAGMFMSARGLYAAKQGAQIEEISDAIEPLFTRNDLGLDLDLTDVKGLVDFKKENIYFFCKSTSEPTGYVILFNYYFGEWFILEGVDGTHGFQLFDDDLVYLSDGRDIYVEQSTNTGSLGYYRSNFDTMGEPGLEKKFLQTLLYTMNTTQDFDINFKSYKNWNTEDTITDQTKSFSAGEVDVKSRLNNALAKSCAIEINSPEDSQLQVSGYEYEYSMKATQWKGDDS